MFALAREATIVLSTPICSISAMRTFLLGLFAVLFLSVIMVYIIMIFRSLSIVFLCFFIKFF